MRILFAGGGTGGHLYPALAIAREVVKAAPQTVIHFVGAQRGIERDLLPATEFAHTLLKLHPLYRSAPWRNISAFPDNMRSLFAISRLFKQFRPDLVVATGGYVAALTLLTARLRGVPYMLQEQNAYPGLTVRLFAAGARRIFLGFPEAAAKLRGTKADVIVDSGNPITPPPEQRRERAALLHNWGCDDPTRPVLLIVGGSQGAAPLNLVVSACVHRLADAGMFVIWATGVREFERYRELERPGVRVLSYLDPIADAYEVSHICISRAGAITTAELCAWGVPMILVPLPTAAADHQRINAGFLAAAGCALVLEQEELTAEKLVATTTQLAHDPDRLHEMHSAALERARRYSAQVIAKQIVGG